MDHMVTNNSVIQKRGVSLKNLFRTLFLILGLSSLTYAQYTFPTAPTIKRTLRTTENAVGPQIDLRGTDVQYHTLNWDVTGTVTSCVLAVKAGTDGIAYPTTLISSQTCTSAAGTGHTAISVAGNYPYVRIEYTTPAVGSGSVVATYQGWQINPYTGISISGSGSNPAAGNRGASIPATADVQGINVAGLTQARTGVNPSGSIIAAQGDITSVAGTTVATSGSGIQKVGIASGDNGTSITQTGGSLNVNVTGGVATGVAQGSTTSGQSGSMVQCATTTGAPTYASGTTNPLSCDTAGNTRVAIAANSTINQTQVNGHTILEAGVNGSQVVGGNVSAGSAVSGSVNPNLIAGSDYGGTPAVRTLKVDASGGITANIGTTNGIALDTSVNGILLNQGSTTSGQKGPLVQCAASTSAPTTPNGNTYPLSCDGTGAIRVNVVSGSTGNAAAGATGSGVPAQASYTAVNTGGTLRGLTGTNTSGSVYALDVNVTGGLPADAADAATVTTNPLPVGCVFTTSPSTLTTGQSGYVYCDNNHAVRVTNVYTGSASGLTASMSGTTSTSVIGGTASNYIYVESCSVNNTHASVDTLVDLQDGSGGTVLYTLDAPHGYGGETHYFGKPGLKVPTAGNGLFAVNETTGAAVKVSCNGTKSTVSQ
jgi:hypothetical protein